MLTAPRSLADVRSEAKDVLRIYGSACSRYPHTAIFNVSDIRRLTDLIEELVEPRKGVR